MVATVLNYKKPCKQQFTRLLFYNSVTPPGFEPESSEPESDILSIELWGRKFMAAKLVFFVKEILFIYSRLAQIYYFDELRFILNNMVFYYLR